eukprot:TRINITY_DN2748_c0_g1_i16.p1 TRINITY_DN2748_c0_g1~~TRINITY_DN2748_c0_g1_i16.p1  ORF type:complete len:294 (+),score=58.11 TRINITY_DN2748_c0_g1_i16:73-954(+)
MCIRDRIYIEDSKIGIEPPPRRVSLSELDTVMKRVEQRKERTDEMKAQRLLTLLKESIKGATVTGDSAESLAEIMKKSPVYNHLHNLNNLNLLNIENSVIDFGEKPAMIRGKGIFKCFTTPIVPVSTKLRLIVEYSECAPRFAVNDAYFYSSLEEHQITLDEFNATIKNADEVLMPFKGSTTKTDLCFLLTVFVGLVVFLTVGVVLGMLISYILTIVIVVIFLAAIAGLFVYLRKRNRRLLIYGHLALALFARCENNRKYLRKKILIRPGYMGKWIEFNISANADASQTIEPV